MSDTFAAQRLAACPAGALRGLHCPCGAGGQDETTPLCRNRLERSVLPFRTAKSGTSSPSSQHHNDMRGACPEKINSAICGGAVLGSAFRQLASHAHPFLIHNPKFSFKGFGRQQFQRPAYDFKYMWFILMRQAQND